MADIFISYSRLDLDRVKPMAERLVSLGYSVWWEKQSRAVDEIERELDGARVVLTTWSRSARNSTWVYAEASRALDSGKLLQVRLDDAPLPLPFDALESTDMTSDAHWGPLEDAIARAVRDAAPGAPARTSLGLLATPSAAGAPKLLTIASGAALAAYAAAVSAAANGVMAPDQLQITLIGIVAVGGASALVSAQRLATITRAGG